MMKRVLMVGCSHGRLADAGAKGAALKFAASYKPTLIVHLGDWSDCTCLRGGATGTSDESERILPDIDGGLDFIGQLREHCEDMWVFDGNHEARLFRFLKSPRARDAEFAELLLGRIGAEMKRLRARHIPYRGIWESRRLANYTLMHGAGMGGINSLQQHSNAWGNIVIAHIHAAHQVQALRSDGGQGFSTGCLCDIEAMSYAEGRFNTLRWNHGFVWGEYTPLGAQLWLHSQPRGQKEWLLP